MNPVQAPHPTGPREDGSAWRAFLDGATRPSPAATFGAVTVALVLLATAALAAVPRLLEAVDPGYLMVDGADRDVVLMQRTLELDRSAPLPCVVALLGDSSVQCGLSSRQDLEAQVAAALEAAGRPRDVDARLLMNFGMTLWQKCAVADRIADHVTGALVICVEPDLTFVGNLDPRREPVARSVLESAGLAEEYRLAGFDPPRATGIYVVDHYDFMAPRMLTAMKRMLGTPIRVAELPSGAGILPDAKLRRELARSAVRYNQQLQRLPDWHAGLDVLGRLIDRFRARSTAPVVLLESPRHPLLRSALRVGDVPFFDSYLSIMRRFAAAHGAQHWCIDVEAGVSEADFGDAVHIGTDEGRARFTSRLAERLAELLAAGGSSAK